MSEDTPVQRLKIAGKFYVIMPAQEYEVLARSVGELSQRLRAPIEASPAIPVASEGESSLRTWRKHRGLTLEKLGLIVGSHKVNISALERGKQKGTIKTWRKLAEALNVPLDDILPLS